MGRNELASRDIVAKANNGLEQGGRAYILVDGSGNWLEIAAIDLLDNDVIAVRLIRDDVDIDHSMAWIPSARLAAVRLEISLKPEEPS